MSTLSRQGEGNLGHGGSKDNPEISGSQQRNSTTSGMSGVKLLMMIVDLVDKQREEDEKTADAFIYPNLACFRHDYNTDLHDLASINKKSTISHLLIRD